MDHKAAGPCTGYAIRGKYTVYLSLIGRVTAVKAVWAAFIDHQALTLPDETRLWRLPTDEETKYLWQRGVRYQLITQCQSQAPIAGR